MGSGHETAVVDAIVVFGTHAGDRHRVASALVLEQNRTLVELSERGSMAGFVEQLRTAVRDAIEPDSTRQNGNSDILIELPATAHAPDVIGLLVTPHAISGTALRLSSVVTVVDIARLTSALSDDDYVAFPGEADGGGTLLTANALLTVLHVEYSTEVLVVNWFGLDPAALEVELALVNHLNPTARVSLWPAAPTARSSRQREIGTEWSSAGWIRVLNDQHTPYLTHPRVSAFRYEQFRPFHPGRLSDLLDTDFDGGQFGWIVRSAGFCRFATRHGRIAHWTQVGCMITFDPRDLFGRQRGADDVAEPADTEILAIGQDIAFIGIDLDAPSLTAALDACVLTDSELLAGPDRWAAFADPFPEWPLSIRPG